MTWLYEDPWTVVMFCLAVGIAVEIVCYQVSQHAMLMGALGVLLLTGLLLGVEHFIVTDNELIEDTLYGAAASVSSGEYDQVKPFLISQPLEIEPLARTMMERYHVRKVRLTDLKISINRLALPPTATVDVWAHLELAGDVGRADPFGVVTLQLENGKWLISHAEAKNLIK